MDSLRLKDERMLAERHPRQSFLPKLKPYSWIKDEFVPECL